MRGQNNKFFKQVFLSGKSRKSKHIKWGRTNKFTIFQKKIETYLGGFKQTIFLHKFLGPESRKSRTYQKMSNKQVFNFSKIVGRVSQENRKKSMRGQINKFFKQVFWSGKLKMSKRIKWG